MRLGQVRLMPVPGNPGRVRLQANVEYADRTSEPYWFEVERDLEDSLSTSGNPWLTCLLPLAVTFGEPLEIPLPVDPVLYEGANHVMHIWKGWYPQLHIVPLHTDVAVSRPAARGEKAAAFFSGGADSFYTVLRHQNGQSAGSVQIDDLLFVWGADIRVTNSDGFVRARGGLERAASELGRRLVPVGTNLRETRWSRSDWAHLSHGALLASVALALEGRYHCAMIASSTPYTRLRPWGSHPLTDALLSTSNLRVIHDAAYVNRVTKLKDLVHSDIAMRYLRVCWRSEAGDNCCVCEKCCRTMAILSAIGALDKCATFRPEEFRFDRVARIYSKLPGMPTLHELESLARATGNHQLVRAVRRSMRFSRRLQMLLPVIRRFKGKRVVRHVVDKLESRLLAPTLT